MVEFLLGIVVGIVITFIFLHYYGKHLDLRKKEKMGEFIREYTEANNYATS
jgi:UDP-galactopyranose mutase